MATDPIRIPIIAEDKASADLKKVGKEADKLDKKKVKVAVDTDQSTGMLGRLKGAIGSIGPMVAGAGVALGTVGAAVGKMVGNWQSLALEVGKFRDATGVSADSASRFVELAKDMGLSVETVQSMIGKLNKTAGATPEVFAELGVEIAKTKSGATDVQATFLNAVDAISNMTDPTAQAAAATKLFGKNWQEASEIIVGGAGNVKRRLDSLAGTKLVDDSEIEQAKKVRDQFDAMHDSVENLSNVIGQKLAPALGDAADAAAKIGTKLGPVLSTVLQEGADQLELWGNAAGFAGDVAGRLGDSVGRVTHLWGDHTAAAADATDAAVELTGAQQAAAIAADGAGVSFDEAAVHLRDVQQAELDAAFGADRFKGKFSEMKAALDMKHESDQLIAQLGGAILTVGSGAQLTKDDVYSIETAIIDVGNTAKVNPIFVKSTIDKVDRGDLAGALNDAQTWANMHPVTVKFRIDQNVPQSPYTRGGVSYTPTAAAATAAPMVAAAAGPTVTVPAPSVRITVNAGMVTDTANLVRSLSRAERQTSRLLGSQWRTVAAA